MLLNHLLVNGLDTKKERHLHVTRIKEFLFSTTADPLDIARRDYLEFYVEEITTHRGNVKKVYTPEFFVKWVGYSWEEQ